MPLSLASSRFGISARWWVSRNPHTCNSASATLTEPFFLCGGYQEALRDQRPLLVSFQLCFQMVICLSIVFLILVSYFQSQPPPIMSHSFGFSHSWKRLQYIPWLVP